MWYLRFIQAMSLRRRRSTRSPAKPGMPTILPLPLIVFTPTGLPFEPEPEFEFEGGDGVAGVGSVRFSQLFGFVSFLSRRPTSLLPLPQLTESRTLSRASITSLSSPPSNLSLPVPPSIESEPAIPISTSSPAPPPIASLPVPPFRRLGSSLPEIVSLPE